MEEVEQFVIFMGAYELYTFIDEHETCPIASHYKVFIANLLEICIREFDENIYVVDTRDLPKPSANGHPPTREAIGWMESSPIYDLP